MSRARNTLMIPEDFLLQEKKHAGGATGSSAVEDKFGVKWQYKCDVRDSSLPLKRKLKSAVMYSGNNIENFNEIIAAAILKPVLDPNNEGLVPEVRFVYDKKNKSMAIASKYLQGVTGSLDDHIVKLSKNTIVLSKQKHHIVCVQHPADATENQFNIAGNAETMARLRKDITRGIVASILVGDHDVNPGNFIAVTRNADKESVDRITRIDFGHAFHNLLRGSKKFGGEVRNKNLVLDYFNRRNVGGTHVDFKQATIGGQSKLWRSFPGIAISQECSDALRDYARLDMKSGLDAAKEQFVDLFAAMRENKDKQGLKNARETLQNIVMHLDHKKSNHTHQNDQAFLDDCFARIAEYISNIQKDMHEVQKLVQYQLDIDSSIRAKQGPSIELRDRAEIISVMFSDNKKTPGAINWIRTDSHGKHAAETFDEYYLHRAAQLEQQDRMLKSPMSSRTPSTTRSIMENLNLPPPVLVSLQPQDKTKENSRTLSSPPASAISYSPSLSSQTPSTPRPGKRGG